MRSSDQRYFQVRRTKREANLYPEIAALLSDARRVGEVTSALEEAVQLSAQEFTHILLACGRTANDFRRNFRRGCANHNIVTAAEIAPYEALLSERLDGYVCYRLSKEQHWNVRERFGKLRPQDVLIHDPQGGLWTRLIEGRIAGPDLERLGILSDLRERGEALFDLDDALDLSTLLLKELERRFRSYAAGASDAMPEFTDVGLRNAAVREYVKIKRLLTWEPDYETMFSKADVRERLEQCLVVVEAYVDGGDVRAALFDPDTSKRHCSEARLFARLSHVEDRLIELGDCDQRYYTVVSA